MQDNTFDYGLRRGLWLRTLRRWVLLSTILLGLSAWKGTPHFRIPDSGAGAQTEYFGIEGRLSTYEVENRLARQLRHSPPLLVIVPLQDGLGGLLADIWGHLSSLISTFHATR